MAGGNVPCRDFGMGHLGCRVEPGEWHCTKQGPAPQLCLCVTTFFILVQLQKASDPWVLNHSDLEKQDNSWKEVREVAGSWLHCKIPRLGEM